MLKTLILRFADPSAWRGLFMLIAAYGIELSPEQAYAVASFGMAAVGAFGLMPDHFVFKDYLTKAGGQASTWRGLVMIATAWGIHVSPEQAQAIAAFGMAAAGALGLMPDKFEFKGYLQKAGGQASTWRGLVMIATAWGGYVSPEQGAAIAALGMALVGGVGVAAPAPAPALERLRK
jgi:hypothetical protein